MTLAAGAFAGLLLTGCASAPKDPEARQAYNEANDPIEPTNRTIFDFNQAFDRNLLKPAAQGYRDTVPDGMRASVRNILQTLRAPVTFGNELLQGEFGRAAETFMRLGVNLVLGFGGLFDVAGKYGMQRYEEDFGQTLAVWGFHEGPYLMLPIFGPSNVRDGIGLAADSFADPLGYFVPFAASAGRSALEGVDKRAEVIEPLDEIERTSVDFYATLRSLYRQRRNDEINNGQPGMNLPAPSISYDVIEEDKPAPPAATPPGPDPSPATPAPSSPSSGMPSS